MPTLRLPELSGLPRDALAGLLLAAIAIPEQLATARLAGMPPEAGLFSFAAGAIGFAVFGTNRFLSAGADSTIAPIFAGALAALAASGSPQYAALAGLLSLMVGIVLVGAALLRRGLGGRSAVDPGDDGVHGRDRGAHHRRPGALACWACRTRPGRWRRSAHVGPPPAGHQPLRTRHRACSSWPSPRPPSVSRRLPGALLALSSPRAPPPLLSASGGTALTSLGALPATLPHIALPAALARTMSRGCPAGADRRACLHDADRRGAARLSVPPGRSAPRRRATSAASAPAASSPA